MGGGFSRKPGLESAALGEDELTALLREEPVLNLLQFHWRGTSFVIIRHVIDPRAHGVAPHQPSIAGLQQIERRIQSHLSGVRVAVKAGQEWSLQTDLWHQTVSPCGIPSPATGEAFGRRTLHFFVDIYATWSIPFFTPSPKGGQERQRRTP